MTMGMRGRAAARGWRWEGLLAAAALLALAVPMRAAAAPAITVSASVESTDVAVGEPFLLSIVVDGAQNVPVPNVAVKGFRADYIGPSTQVSFVNGHTSASVTHRYRMIADEEGQFTLGPFVIGYEDQRYETKPIAVRVRPSGTHAQAQAVAPGGNQDLRLVVQPTRSEAYVGERVGVTLTLYVGDIRVRDLQFPVIHADGVTVEKFGQPDQGTEVVNGRRYTTVRLKTRLTPVRPGPIELTTTMNVSVVTNRRGGFDSFFDQLMPGDAKQVEVQAEPTTLTVLPLPEEGRPAGFGGAVGTYQFDLTAKPTSLQVGDPITLRMEITGTGTFATVTPPELPTGTAFRRYDAQPVKGEDDDAHRVFEQVIIPNSVDVHEIPALHFSFFDPDAHAYTTITKGPIPIEVQAAAPSHAGVVDSAPAVAPTPATEAPLGHDIVYIKDAPGAVRPRGERASRGAWLVLLALPVALFAALQAWARRRDRLAGDPRLLRFRAAGRDAQRALAVARAQNGRERVDAISGAVTSYLAAKLDLPPGAVERDRVLQRLGAGGVADGVQSEVARFFALAEEARYASGAPGSTGDAVGDAADRVVAALERERGLERRLGAIALILLGARVARRRRARGRAGAGRASCRAIRPTPPAGTTTRSPPTSRRAPADRRVVRSTSTSATPTSSAATSDTPSPTTSGRPACCRATPTSPPTSRSPASAPASRRPVRRSGNAWPHRSPSARASRSWRSSSPCCGGCSGALSRRACSGRAPARRWAARPRSSRCWPASSASAWPCA